MLLFLESQPQSSQHEGLVPHGIQCGFHGLCLLFCQVPRVRDQLQFHVGIRQAIGVHRNEVPGLANSNMDLIRRRSPDFQLQTSTALCVVHTAKGGHAAHTAPVHIHLATGTFHALVHQPVKEGATVVAEGGTAVAVQTELVLVARVLGSREESFRDVGAGGF